MIAYAQPRRTNNPMLRETKRNEQIKHILTILPPTKEGISGTPKTRPMKEGKVAPEGDGQCSDEDDLTIPREPTQRDVKLEKRGKEEQRAEKIHTSIIMSP